VLNTLGISMVDMHLKALKNLNVSLLGLIKLGFVMLEIFFVLIITS